MKKVLSLILVAVLCLSLVACGDSSAESKVASYVNKYGDDFRAGMEETFAGTSGMTCRSSIKAVGTGIVVDMIINELEDVSQDVKDAMQDAYDSMDSEFEAILETIQEEVPEVTYLKINVCEKDGDVMATMKAGK